MTILTRGHDMVRAWVERTTEAWWRRPRRFGLRLRLNAIIVPVFVGTLALFVWLDFRHELQALAAIQAARSVPERGHTVATAASPATDPETLARRSLAIHTLHGALTIVLLVTATNIALTAFVLDPVERIRARMAQMERGYWRAEPTPVGSDEMAALQEDFRRFGLTLDALVAQALRAESQASVALVSKRTTRLIAPEVQRIAAASATLQQAADAGTRQAALGIAIAAARITAATESLDRLFDSTVERHRYPLAR